MPLILFGAFFLMLVLHEFGLPGMLPFWDPWLFFHWARPSLGPQLVTFRFLFLFFTILVVEILGWGSNLRMYTL